MLGTAGEAVAQGYYRHTFTVDGRSGRSPGRASQFILRQLPGRRGIRLPFAPEFSAGRRIRFGLRRRGRSRLAADRVWQSPHPRLSELCSVRRQGDFAPRATNGSISTAASAVSICAIASGSSSRFSTVTFEFPAMSARARDGFGYYGIFGGTFAIDQCPSFSRGGRYAAFIEGTRPATRSARLRPEKPPIAGSIYSAASACRFKLFDFFAGNRGRLRAPVLANHQCLIREERPASCVAEYLGHGADLISVGSADDA